MVARSLRMSWRPICAALATAGLLAGTLWTAALPAAAATGKAYTVSRVPIVLARQIADDPATDTAYLTSDDELQVFDCATKTVTGTISLAPYVLQDVAVNPVTDTVYVTGHNPDTGAGFIGIIDGASESLTATISEPDGVFPVGVAVDTATNMAYVANDLAGTVSVINGATSTVAATISLGSSNRPDTVAVDPATDVVYVGQSSGTMWIIDGGTDAVTASMSLGTVLLAGLAVDPGTDTLYAADDRNWDVIVIDGASNTVTTTISTGYGVDDVAVDPASDTVFASGAAFGSPLFTGATSVIDAGTNTVTATLPRGGYTIAADPSTGIAYAPGIDVTGPQLWVITPTATEALSPVIDLGPAIDFPVRVTSSVTVVQSAMPFARFTESGRLPAGVKLRSGGSLAGTPAKGTEGSYPIKITGANGVAPDDTISVTLVVYKKPAFISPPRVAFIVGEPGRFVVAATGSPAPTLSESGPLPTGVTFSPDGTLAGTPAAGTDGSYQIAITAANAYAQATQTFTLNIDQFPAITSASHAAFTAGVRNSFTVVTSGFPAARLRERGPLPAGVHFVAHKNGTAKLVGVPARSTRGRSYVIIIVASNGVGRPARQTFTLRIRRHRG